MSNHPRIASAIIPAAGSLMNFLAFYYPFNADSFERKLFHFNTNFCDALIIRIEKVLYFWNIVALIF
jgi:hypothetical protein